MNIDEIHSHEKSNNTIAPGITLSLQLAISN